MAPTTVEERMGRKVHTWHGVGLLAGWPCVSTFQLDWGGKQSLHGKALLDCNVVYQIAMKAFCSMVCEYGVVISKLKFLLLAT